MYILYICLYIYIYIFIFIFIHTHMLWRTATEWNSSGLPYFQTDRRANSIHGQRLCIMNTFEKGPRGALRYFQTEVVSTKKNITSHHLHQSSWFQSQIEPRLPSHKPGTVHSVHSAWSHFWGLLMGPWISDVAKRLLHSAAAWTWDSKSLHLSLPIYK